MLDNSVGDVVTSKEMKFLFLLNTNFNANQCCFGCTLRDGVKAIALPYIVINALYIIFLSGNDDSLFIRLPLLAINFIQMVSPIMLLYASCTNNFKSAYYGTIIFEVFIYIGIAENIYTGYYFHFTKLQDVIAYVFYVIAIESIYIYSCFITYSFTKELGKGNLIALDSKVLLNSLGDNNPKQSFELAKNITIRNLSQDLNQSTSSDKELNI